MTQETVLQIPMDKILPSYILLRMVDKRSMSYLELRDSIKESGLLNSICVRTSTRQEGFYEIVDGMYRYSCCKDLNYNTIPAIITEANDAKVLILQIQANAVRANTTPVEYANQIKKLFIADSGMTFATLSNELKKSPAWIKKTLGLLNLTPPLATRVDRGEIPLTSAYMLAKLPKWLQQDEEENAIVMPVKEFCRICQDRLIDVRQLKADQRKNNYYREQAKPHPYLQFYRVITSELKHLAVGPTLLIKNNITKPIDAWRLAIAWVLHLDPDNIKLQENKIKERIEKEQKSIAYRIRDREMQRDKELIDSL
jgi:ParB/RepB/Spo0J family partition protein